MKHCNTAICAKHWDDFKINTMPNKNQIPEVQLDATDRKAHLSLAAPLF